MARFSIRYRIVSVLLLVLISWAAVLSYLLRFTLAESLVRAGLDAATLNRISYQFTLVSTGLTLIGILVFLWLSLKSTKVVTSSLQDLIEGAERIGRGDRNVRIDVTSNDEFGQLAEAFNQMVEKLSAVDKMKSEFISTASHELRTPLATILGFSELLIENEFTAKERREYLMYIHEKAEILADLVEELLDISRIEEGRGLVLSKCVWKVEEIFRKKVDEIVRTMTTGHALELNLPEESVPILVDRLRVERVLENLLSNAIKYSPRGSPIRIGVNAAGGELSVSVQDEGTGMTPEQVEKIFDKFYRADTSNTAASGFGLGMSIVKDIIEAHGGDISVESTFGRGTTVFFTLPTA